MKKLAILCLVAVCFWLACTNDTFEFTGVDCNEAVTYDGRMQEIIDTNCAYSGCHDGANAPGDYTDYSGLSVHFGGEIFSRVVERVQDTVLGMPPNYAEGGPKDLSEEDFMLFNCWIDQEFPEN